MGQKGSTKCNLLMPVQIIGVTKERVRQIQGKALSKLHAVMQTKIDGEGGRCYP